MLLFLSFCLPSIVFAWPTGHKQWWKKYGILKANENPQVKRANNIFEKILITAGIPDNISPELVIINRNNKPWALALEDGTIVLSKKALDICFMEGEQSSGDARLAFVLGHELAHIKNKDFWHLAAFKTIEDSDLEKDIQQALSDVFKENPSERRKKEIQADSDGLLYAAMAGFHINFLFEHNFFEDWIDQSPDSNAYSQPVHILMKFLNASFGFNHHKYPTAKERAGFLAEYAKSIEENLFQFHFGVRLYQLGKYSDALDLLEQFQQVYYGREIQNNLGLLYYWEGLSTMATYHPQKAYRFKLANIIDTKTMADNLRSRNAQQLDHEFKQQMKKAKRKLSIAHKKAPEYLPALINYSTVLILDGDYTGAVSKLAEAEMIQQNNPHVLMNQAIVKYEQEGFDAAKTLFENLIKNYPDYPDLFYNYGRLLFENGLIKETRANWEIYLNLEGAGVYSDIVRDALSLSAWQPKSYTEGFIAEPPVKIGSSGRKAKQKLPKYHCQPFQNGLYYFNDKTHVLVIENEVNIIIQFLHNQVNLLDFFSTYGKAGQTITHHHQKTLVYQNFAVDVSSNDKVVAIIYF